MIEHQWKWPLLPVRNHALDPLTIRSTFVSLLPDYYQIKTRLCIKSIIVYILELWVSNISCMKILCMESEEKIAFYLKFSVVNGTAWSVIYSWWIVLTGPERINSIKHNKIYMLALMVLHKVQFTHSNNTFWFLVYSQGMQV